MDAKRITERSSVLQAIETAYEYAKENINLSGCYYGKSHVGGPFIECPIPYYFFLAGLVAKLRCSRILEVGAHFGGSIFSMARGVEHAGLVPCAEIVTIDIEENNSEAFRANQLVKRVLGDCLNDDVTQKVSSLFTGHVDLMFIDAVHYFEHTHRCLEQYLPLVSPWLVILDDIRLNPSMEKLWAHLSATYGDRAIDITDCSHRGKLGFGILIGDLSQKQAYLNGCERSNSPTLTQSY
jgi:cephalosporin hydroxylase